MERHFPRCTDCMEPLSGNEGLRGALEVFFKKTVICGSCGKQVLLSDARITGENFARSVGRFYKQLNFAVNQMPEINQSESLAVMGVRMFSKDVHRIHTREELIRLLVRGLRMSLRHEAMGYPSPISLDALRRGGRVRALRIRAVRTGSGAPEVLILITRVGADDYLAYEATAHGAVEPADAPEIQTRAKADTVLGVAGAKTH
ncbi:MAG TPA: hypothetical protein VMG59_04535 [Phycisphaerae bacterium]|nr:hypothetical protein [Phycisphaerae bacterium]